MERLPLAVEAAIPSAANCGSWREHGDATTATYVRFKTAGIGDGSLGTGIRIKQGERRTQSFQFSRIRVWRPLMLSRRMLACLAGALAVAITLLQVLDMQLRRQQGIAAVRHVAVNCLRYLPTVVVVFLGFTWRSLISDLKLVMPWSAMTQRSAPILSSLQANYINNIEIVSLWTAARRRHWPLYLGLAGGLLAAVLLSFTNALTYVDPAAKITKSVPSISQTSDFDFDGRFVHGNASLTMPWDYNGSGPYAALTSAQQPNGKYPPWTVDGHAFTTFTAASVLGDNFNGTLTASANVFTASLNCSAIRTSIIAPSMRSKWWRAIRPNADDLADAGCMHTTQINLTDVPGGATDPFDYYSPGNRNQTLWTMQSAGLAMPAGWLNLTQCGTRSHPDVRIWATLLRPTDGDPKAPGYDITSLLCRPQYSMQRVSLSVNASTGDVKTFAVLADAMDHDAGIAPDALLTYLNSPLNGISLDAYQETSWQGTAVTNAQLVTPQVSYVNVTNWADYYFRLRGQDLFFAQLLNSYDTLDFNELFNNSTTFGSAVSGLMGNYVVQLANVMARRSVTGISTPGKVEVQQPRLLVRQWALRAAQGCMAVLAIICILLATILRPENVLDHAGSGTSLDVSAKARVYRTVNGAVRIDVINNDAKGGTILRSDRFRPTSLHWLYVSIVVLMGVALLAAAGATLRSASEGLAFSTGQDSWLVQTAWAFAPTVLLLLLGYGLGGLGDAATLLEPYRRLRTRNGRPGYQTMLSSPANHSVFSLPYKATVQLGSLVILGTSLIVLTYPGVKIAAAGLYTASIVDRLAPIGDIVIDSSLTDYFEGTYDLAQSVTAAITDRASQWNEWSQIGDFNLPPRMNTMDNMVFTETRADYGDAIAIDAVVPAVEVHVACHPLRDSDFSLRVSQMYNAYWGTTANFMFHSKTADVKEGGTKLVDYYAMTMRQNSLPGIQYVGAAFPPLDSRTEEILPGGQYTMLLGDYTSVAKGVRNKTYVPTLTDYSSNMTVQSIAIEAAPGMFNVSLPTLRGVICARDFNKVYVNATLTRGQGAGQNGTTTTLPWAVSAYDPASISDRKAYNRSTPGWMYPYYPVGGPSSSSSTGDWNSACSGGDAAEVVGSSLWPSKGTSRNVWQQMAVHQQSQQGSADITSALLDVNELAKNAEAVLTSYSVQVLSELRPYTSRLAQTHGKRDPAAATIPVQVHRRMPAVTQSRPVTYAIAAMLATVIICALLAASAYVPLPGRPRPDLGLSDAPGSITAATALLAGSRIVRELREAGVTHTSQTRMWERHFRLGWWDEEGCHDEPAKDRRWGIDYVE